MIAKDSAKQDFYFNTDWLDTHPAHANLDQVLPMSSEAKSFADFFWPATMDYQSPNFSIFSTRILNLSALNKRPAWFLRDGLIPLLWFFKIHKSPSDLKSKLYIHHSLAHFVPENWAPKLGTYQVVSTSPLQTPVAPEVILFTGQMFDGYLPIQKVAEFFQALSKNPLYQKIKHLPKQAFLPSRTGYTERDMSYPINFMTQFCKVAGNDIHGITNSNFRGRPNFEKHIVIDINTGIICCDPEPVQFALSKGAQLFAQQQKQKNATYKPLSPYHGMLVSEKIDPRVSIYKKSNQGAKEYAKFREHLMDTLYSDAHNSLPWPRWFNEYHAQANHGGQNGKGFAN